MSTLYLSAVQYVGPLHKAQRGVLYALAELANAEGKTWPSHDRLAAISGMSATTVSKALKGLAGAGLVTVEPRRRNDGTHASAIVTLFPHGRPASGRSHAAIMAARAGEGGQ